MYNVLANKYLLIGLKKNLSLQARDEKTIHLYFCKENVPGAVVSKEG